MSILLQYSIGMSKKELCRLFGMTRQAWYKHQQCREAELFDEGRIVEIVRIFHQAHEGLHKSSGKSMYRMLKPELVRHGITMGRDKFHDVLSRNGLLYKRRPLRTRTTYSEASLPLFPNLVEGIEVLFPETVWVADITYIRVAGKFEYLSIVTDAYSRRVMGYCLNPTLEAVGCIIALEMALANRRYPWRTLIHHSDRGFQYRARPYQQLMGKNSIRASMTQSGDPKENAIAERVNGILKVDMGIADTEYQNREDALAQIRATVESYNLVRPHSSIDYLVPDEAHNRTGKLKKHWKGNDRTNNA